MRNDNLKFYKTILRTLSVLFFILPSFKAWAVLGSDIPNVTPAGTTIYEGRLSTDNIEIDIDIFYFYKNHLIGRSSDNQYFIYDEQSHQLQRFKKENNWREAIQKQNLQPQIWTRWHSGRWSDMNNWFVLFIVITMVTMGTPFLIIGICLFYMYQLTKTIFESDKILPKMIYGLSIGFVVLIILLQWHPQSI